MIEIEPETVYWTSWVKGTRFSRIERFLTELARKTGVIVNFKGKDKHFLMEKVHFTVSGEEIDVLSFQNQLNSEIETRTKD